MSKIALLAAALVFALTCMGSADGFSCYQCGYLEDGGEGSDKSCKTGKKPDGDFKKECILSTTLDNFPAAFHPFIEAQNNASRNAVAGNKQIDYGCGKFVIDSLGTMRICVPKLFDVEDKCDEATVKEIATGLGIWRPFVLPWSDAYGSNAFTGCFCSGENCNSAFSVKFSIALLVSSLTLAFFTN